MFSRRRRGGETRMESPLHGSHHHPRGDKAPSISLPREEDETPIEDRLEDGQKQRKTPAHTDCFHGLEPDCSPGKQSDWRYTTAASSGRDRSCSFEVVEVEDEMEDDEGGWHRIPSNNSNSQTLSSRFKHKSSGFSGLAQLFIQRSSSHHSLASDASASPTSSRRSAPQRSLSQHYPSQELPSSPHLELAAPPSASQADKTGESSTGRTSSTVRRSSRLSQESGKQRSTGETQGTRSQGGSCQEVQDVQTTGTTEGASSYQDVQVADPAIMGYFEMAEILLNSDEIQGQQEQQQLGAMQQQHFQHHQDQQEQLRTQGNAFNAPLYITPMQAVHFIHPSESLISPASSALPPQSSLSTSEWSQCTKSLLRTHSAATRNGVPVVNSSESIQIIDQLLAFPTAFDDGDGFFSPLEANGAQSFSPPTAGNFLQHPFIEMGRSITNPDNQLHQQSSSTLPSLDDVPKSYSCSAMPVTDPAVESYFLQKEMALSADLPLVLKSQHCGPLQVMQVADPQVMNYFWNQESKALMAEEPSVTGSVNAFGAHA